MEIKSTTEYKMFKFLPDNRPIIQSHVNTLVNKIASKNLLHLRLGITDKFHNIIDGQHRLKAAEILKIPFFYFCDPAVTKDDIAFLNSGMKNWSVKDYAHFFAKQGNKKYINFQLLLNAYPKLNPSSLMTIMSIDGTRNAINFRTGQLDMSNEEQGRKILSYCELIYNQFDYAFERNFLIAMRKITDYRQFNINYLIKNLSSDRLVRCNHWRDYVKVIEHVYNKGLDAPIKFMQTVKNIRK